MQSLVQQIRGSNQLDRSEKDKLLAQLTQLYAKVDVEYLHCVYFPETSEPARVPCKFGMPSSVFTQSFQFYVNTGANGSGFIGIAPQDTTHYFCFSNVDPLVGEHQNTASSHSRFKWEGESGSYIPEKFSFARVTGCSIRVSYIGSRDEEAGFMCGSHIFSAGPTQIDEKIIEDGFFKTQVAPAQGIRMVYLPKDDADLEYAPQEFKFEGAKDATVEATDWFATHNEHDAEIGENGNMRLQVKQLESISNPVMTWGNVQSTQTEIAPSWYWGLHTEKRKSQFPNMMVIYFRGMAPDVDALRVDVVRHIEALPRQELRDFVGVRRRGPSDKTVEFVKAKSMETKLHSHDLQDAKALENVIKPNIHKVVDMPEAVYTTPSTNSHWYDGLTKMLPDVGSMLGGLAGSEFGPAGMAVGSALGHAFGSAGEAYMSPHNVQAQATYGGGVPYTGNVQNTPVRAITF